MDLVTIRETDTNPPGYCNCCWVLKRWNHPHLRDSYIRLKPFKQTCAGKVRTRQRLTKRKLIPMVTPDGQTTVDLWHGVDDSCSPVKDWDFETLKELFIDW